MQIDGQKREKKIKINRREGKIEKEDRQTEKERHTETERYVDK